MPISDHAVGAKQMTDPVIAASFEHAGRDPVCSG